VFAGAANHDGVFMPRRLPPFNRRIHSNALRARKSGDGRWRRHVVPCARFSPQLSTALRCSSYPAGAGFPLPVRAIGGLVGADGSSALSLGSGQRALPLAVNKPTNAEDHRNSVANNHNNRLRFFSEFDSLSA